MIKIIKIRYSEYLSADIVIENLTKLREYFNVGYYESIYNIENKMFKFEYKEGRQIVRCFPTSEDRIGIIYVDKNEINKKSKLRKKEMICY